jgi:hypothetical protein
MGQASVASVLGDLHLSQGDPTAAHTEFDTALRYAREIDNPLEEALALEGLGRCASLAGEPKASALLRQALAIFTGIGAADAARVEQRIRDNITPPK